MQWEPHDLLLNLNSLDIYIVSLVRHVYLFMTWTQPESLVLYNACQCHHRSSADGSTEAGGHSALNLILALGLCQAQMPDSGHEPAVSMREYLDYMKYREHIVPKAFHIVICLDVAQGRINGTPTNHRVNTFWVRIVSKTLIPS